MTIDRRSLLKTSSRMLEEEKSELRQEFGLTRRKDAINE